MNARAPIPIIPVESLNSAAGSARAGSVQPSDVTDSHGERVIPSRERASSLAEGALGEAGALGASREARAEGVSCNNKQELHAAAKAAGKADTLNQYAKDYPKGPHDQPQSMCPAFGSLRVGLRMRRTATILSGSACCVYGLTFTSHFYGARLFGTS